VLLILVHAAVCAGQGQKKVAVPSHANAQATPPDQNATNWVPDVGASLQIAISPSTPHIIRGADYSLDTEIKNVSKRPVALDIESARLAVQPEVASSRGGCVMFFTPYYSDSISKTEVSMFILQPGDHVTLYFNLGEVMDLGNAENQPCVLGHLSNIRKTLDFMPGNYTFELSGKVRMADTDFVPGQAAPKWSDPRLFSQSSALQIGIDQTNILCFAAIGGLLAYFVMALRPQGEVITLAAQPLWSRDWFKKLGHLIKNVLGAAFLSAAVTIVASRLSDTQFPVKVSVEDFWGAVTIGFVAYFVGGKFIDQLAGLVKK